MRVTKEYPKWKSDILFECQRRNWKGEMSYEQLEFIIDSLNRVADSSRAELKRISGGWALVTPGKLG